MTSLKKLHARCNCGIGQNSIIGLNLVDLDVGYNNKIINVSFMNRISDNVSF